MKVHYVGPKHGYHEPDDFNPLYCGTEAEVPEATSDWKFVTCKRCLRMPRWSRQ